MQGLELKLDTNPRAPVDEIKTTESDDALGSTLQGKWTAWSTARRQIEEEWLKDLRAFNQQNEPNVSQLSKFHSHIYLGVTRTKCLSAYSRITDLMFQSRDRHWGIEPTPVPDSQMQIDGMQDVIDIMKAKAEAMENEIADKMADMHYEDHVKSSILEGCIIGTGCIKGVVTTVKLSQKWVQSEDGWTVQTMEEPAPKMSAPSIFDIYPDPYANRVEDMSGLFERHTLNRQQFADLKEDERFDKAKIDEILRMTDKGNHIPLYHETERRTIAGIVDASATMVERYDLLEYWGQVSGRLLESAGIDDVKEEETYWANVWSCAGKTLLAKVAPILKQKIPYHFFIYNKVPHQFWGVSPARMMRHTQAVMNGTTRALLDGMAMASMPMAEVNVSMLKDGQDPSVLKPGMIWLKDNGSPSDPAVRFFQPSVPTNQLIQMTELFKGYADDETALPAYTYGDQSNEVNKTAQGISMQMNAASLPLKAVVKNLEDFGIRPFITSLFDWLMEWSDKEEIKGDMSVEVLGTSALMAKETRSQQLMQFLNLTANPMDVSVVDRKYLLEQIAKTLEIDTKKAIPEQTEQQPQQDQPSILDQARAALYEAQAEQVKANIGKLSAEETESIIRGLFASIQAAGMVVGNPAIAQVADSVYQSAGGKDYNGVPLIDNGQAPSLQPMPQNTSPGFPALPDDGVVNNQPQGLVMPTSPAIGVNRGIETAENEIIS